MHTNAYTFRFAAIVTIICSILLAGAATILKPRQSDNIKLDKKTNILASVNIRPEAGQKFSRDEVFDLYEKNISEVVLNMDGEIVTDLKAEDLDPKKQPQLMPLYIKMRDGQADAVVIPVSGKGLWSTIYGYLALDTAYTTVIGITFYSHGETPGLGGEIEKAWFTSNFSGKKIRNEKGELVSIEIVKGKVAEKVTPEEAYHYVDGISGATLTGRGVNNFLLKNLRKYEPYFRKNMKSGEGSI